MKIKIITIKAKSPEERAKKIEGLQNINSTIQCKGSIYYEVSELTEVIGDKKSGFIPINEMYYCADIIFVQGDTPIKDFEKLPIKEVDDKKTVFKPSQEQLKRWKNIKPTTKTIKLLKDVHKFSDEEVKAIKTQWDGHEIIENLKEDKI